MSRENFQSAGKLVADSLTLLLADVDNRTEQSIATDLVSAAESITEMINFLGIRSKQKITIECRTKDGSTASLTIAPSFHNPSK